jgi:hypothetical protein
MITDANTFYLTSLLQRARDRIVEDMGTMQTQNLRLADYEQRIAALEGALREAAGDFKMNGMREAEQRCLHILGAAK